MAHTAQPPPAPDLTLDEASQPASAQASKPQTEEPQTEMPLTRPEAVILRFAIAPDSEQLAAEAKNQDEHPDAPAAIAMPQQNGYRARPKPVPITYQLSDAAKDALAQLAAYLIATENPHGFHSRDIVATADADQDIYDLAGGGKTDLRNLLGHALALYGRSSSGQRFQDIRTAAADLHLPINLAINLFTPLVRSDHLISARMSAAACLDLADAGRLNWSRAAALAEHHQDDLDSAAGKQPAYDPDIAMTPQATTNPTPDGTRPALHPDSGRPQPGDGQQATALKPYLKVHEAWSAEQFIYIGLHRIDANPPTLRTFLNPELVSLWRESIARRRWYIYMSEVERPADPKLMADLFFEHSPEHFSIIKRTVIASVQQLEEESLTSDREIIFTPRPQLG